MSLSKFMLAIIVLLSFSSSGEASNHVCTIGPDFKNDKVAIIFSNANYGRQSLRTIQQDSAALANTLHENGYSVYCSQDLGYKALAKTLSDISDSIHTFTGDLFIYFAGHGWSDGQSNYFVSANSKFNPQTLKASSIDLRNFTRKVSVSSARQIVVVFDICRSILGSASAPPINVEANLIGQKDIAFIYAAGFGSIAADGTGKYSPFGGSLAAYLTPSLGLSVQEAMELVIRNVQRLVPNGMQTPSIVSFSTRAIYLDNTYSGIQGVRFADDLPTYGWQLASNLRPAFSVPNQVRDAFTSMLLTSEEFDFDEECQNYFKNLGRRNLGQKHFAGAVFTPLGETLSLNSSGLSDIFLVEFNEGDPCTTSADGNTYSSVIGLSSKERKWKLLLAEPMVDLAYKNTSQPQFVSMTYVGNMQVTLTEYDMIDESLVRGDRKSVPIGIKYAPTVIDGELLGISEQR